MSWELLAVIALITYASRAGALVLLPAPSPRVRAIIDRIPPALFAGLAAYSLVVPGEGLVDEATVAAAGGALVVAPLRSLPICLVAGVAAYLGWTLLFGPPG